MRRGDLAEAAHRLDELLVHWPEAARFRLDRARVALQRRDLPAYARQVLAVLDQEHGRNRSRGTMSDLLEILRIGGLEDLYREGLAATGMEHTGRAFLGGEMAIQGFATPRVASNFEAMLRFAHLVRREAVAAQASPPLDDASAEVFVTLPIALARLPVPASLAAVPARVLVRLVPELARHVYPYCAATLRNTMSRLQLGRWSLLDMQLAEVPEELPQRVMLGSTMLRVGDLSGDGFDDVLAACTSPAPGEAPGRLLLYDGRTAALLDTVIGESDQHMFAHALAVIDDVDRDGCQDWLVGAPSGSRAARHGHAELWSGKTRLMLDRLEGEEPGFGVAVAGLGDCDGDGCLEFAVATAPLLRNSAAQGSVQIFSGRTHRPLHTLRNDVPGVWFGACIANAGDTDGDAIPDLLVGGNFGQAPGLVRLYSGRTGEVLHSWSDAVASSGFGMFVCGVPDCDGDGRSDVLVSAVRRGQDAGVDQVFLYSGSSGAQLAVLSGDRPGTAFGSAVLPFRRDGRWLLAIGAPHGGVLATGVVAFMTTSGQRFSTLLGPSPGSFGGAIAAVPDDDGDGWPELFVAAPRPNSEGRIWRVASAQLRLGARR
jgi:hypothetical protein